MRTERVYSHQRRWWSQIITAAFVLWVGYSEILAQESPDPASNLHTITVSTGRSLEIGEAWATLPRAFGFDYLYRITPQWEVGVQGDLVWEDHYRGLDLLAGVVVAAYSITPRWPVFAGLGVEHDLTHGVTDVIGRVGTEFTFFLNEAETLAILPGGFVDVSRHTVTPSLVIAFGFFF